MKDLSFNSGIEPLLPAELAPFITRAVHERPSLDRLPTIGCSAPRSLARRGWREDYDRAVTMARATDPVSFATAIAYKYVPLIPSGVLLADDAALAEINAALHVAERSSDADALILVRLAPGIALVHHAGGDRERGFDVLAQLRGPCVTQGYTSNVVPLLDVYRAGEGSTRGSDGRYIPAQQKTWSLRAISATTA